MCWRRGERAGFNSTGSLIRVFDENRLFVEGKALEFGRSFGLISVLQDR